MWTGSSVCGRCTDLWIDAAEWLALSRVVASSLCRESLNDALLHLTMIPWPMLSLDCWLRSKDFLTIDHAGVTRGDGGGALHCIAREERETELNGITVHAF